MARTTEALSELSLRIDLLKTELNVKLNPQKRDLENRLEEEYSRDDLTTNRELEHMADELKKLAVKEQDLQTSLASLTEAIGTLSEERANYQQLLEKADSQQRALVKKLDTFQKEAEKSVIKKTSLITRRDEVQLRISEIGLLSEESLERHQNLETERILRKLNTVNDKISKMSNINRRAIENFKKFNDKREDLESRAEELEQSKESIEKLVESLKKQKVEAVEATFSKVATNFTTIFEKLVPAGIGRLIIHRTTEKSNRGTGQRSPEYSPLNSNADTLDSMYSGVSISVSFNSKNNEQLYVEQLSGGQKTVCAIALILAIQMVDPAPFYLFDEIDAALDKQYRTSVANTIKELSAHAQFICTTFRTDMLQVADSFYRVKFENKISEIATVSKQEAIKFIKGRNKLGEI